MREATEKQALSIERAFSALEEICEGMSSDQHFELHRVRAKIFGALQDNAQYAEPVLNAKGITVREVYLGIVRKRDIGEDNDKFVKSGMLAPWAEDAYFFGQKLVRWNRLMEARWIDRILGRRGPLSASPPDKVCRGAIDAMNAWLNTPSS